MHHKDDEVTRKHFDLLVSHNSEIPVVPIFCNDREHAQGIKHAIPVPKTFSGDAYYNLDWILREWFLSQNVIQSERYIFIEWDCYADISLKKWYQEVWDCDIAAAESKAPLRAPKDSRREKWVWFRRQRHLLPKGVRDHAQGIVPFNGLLLSRRVMEFYSQVPERYGKMELFCELRLPSLLKAGNFEINILPDWKAKNNGYLPLKTHEEVIGKSAMWHPVKQ